MSLKRKFTDALGEGCSVEIFHCKYCDYGSESIDDLDEHIQIHEDSLTIVEEEEKTIKIEEETDSIENEVEFEIENYTKKGRGRPKKDQSTGENVWYKCGLCIYKTKRKHDLPKHFITHCTLKSTTVYRCSECDYETKRKNDMPKHMLGHCNEGVPMYKCPECPYQTKRKNDLPKHLLCHKPPETVTLWYCSQCSYSTKRKGDLHKHEVNHLPKDQIDVHQCSECNYVTKRKNDLHKHMLVHCDRHIEGYFKCLKCDYATDKVHKFSKHALSNCTYWQDAKNVDQINLEDILANADKEGVHVILDDDEFVELQDTEFLENQEENQMEDIDQAYELVEVAHDSQFQTEHSNLVNHYILQENQHEYGNEVKRGHYNARKPNFNLNLGEFSVDEVVKDHQE